MPAMYFLAKSIKAEAAEENACSVFTDINRLCHQPHIQKTAFDAVPDVFGVAAEDLIADTGISIPECRDAVRQNAGRQKLSAADGDGPFQVVLFI